MTRENGGNPPHSMYEEACEWLVEFRTSKPSESTRRAFHAWLKESPAHMAAYVAAAREWNKTGTIDVRAHFPKEFLIGDATSGADNVVSHPRTIDARPVPPRDGIGRYRAASWMWALIAGACAASVAGAIVFTTRIRATQTYTTSIGQNLWIRLTDGSVVDLSARSEIRVHYTASGRTIALVYGEALFSDTQDAIRPFVVTTAGALIRAVGTQFDVNRGGNRTVVTVVTGRVAVAKTGPGSSSTSKRVPPVSSFPHTLVTRRSIYVAAGEQVAVLHSRISDPVRVNVSDVTAWTHHVLAFTGAPLRDVVEQFNRYNVRQLVITDRSLKKLKIDGAFSSVNSKYLLDFLRQYPGVKVTDSGGEILISRG